MKGLRLLACAGAVPALLSSPVWSADIRDTKYGYSVSPPEFAAVPIGSVATRISVLAPPDAGFAANMGVMVQEIKTTRDQFMAESAKQFVANKVSLHSSSKIEVSGRPALILDHEGQVGERALRFLQLAVVLPERVLLVTYTAPAAAFSGLEGEFRRSLASFKLSR